VAEVNFERNHYLVNESDEQVIVWVVLTGNLTIPVMFGWEIDFIDILLVT
jgi:hypothetical protein